jgi:hypothetical protein
MRGQFLQSLLPWATKVTAIRFATSPQFATRTQSVRQSKIHRLLVKTGGEARQLGYSFVYSLLFYGSFAFVKLR